MRGCDLRYLESVNDLNGLLGSDVDLPKILLEASHDVHLQLLVSTCLLFQIPGC